jgi:hypothetical protein
MDRVNKIVLQWGITGLLAFVVIVIAIVFTRWIGEKYSFVALRDASTGTLAVVYIIALNMILWVVTRLRAARRRRY